MKKRLVLLVAVCFAAVCFASAQTPDIRGTWRIVSIDGKQVPQGYHLIKMYTAKHFVWLVADGNNNVIGSHSGTYTLDGNTLEETLEYVSPNGHDEIKGKKQKSILTGDASRLTVDTDTDNDDEIWEKID